LAPQPSIGLGLLLKIQLNFLEASQQFSFYRVGLLARRPTLIPEDQASIFISPRGRVTTHFSRLLRHAWLTVGLFLFPGHPTGTSTVLPLGNEPSVPFPASNSPLQSVLEFFLHQTYWLWVVTLCSEVVGYRRFGGSCSMAS
jgi:hypothetical protein